jgi:tRNA A-37 threonylcarbamoyl transferase component Bud32
MDGEQPIAGETTQDQPERDLTGQVLGDFKILRLIGRGGMGEVYLAEQLSLKRSVALKVLRPDLVNNENYIRRFETEAKAVAPINHPNIVSVIAIGQQDGVRYIAMEYVHGMNLRQYLNRKGPLDVQAGIGVMRKVGAALARAAEEGIVHRDIKPENVLLTKKGDVKVADFGLARQVTREDLNLTQSGTTVGTPMYMSPEQVEGKELDHRSDLYSFGVTCYHMLAGTPPYRGETAMAIAVQHCTGKPTPLSVHRSDLPPQLIRIVEKLMSRNPDDRYQTAREFLRDLARVKAPSGGKEPSLGLDSDETNAEALTATASLSGWRNPAAMLARVPAAMTHFVDGVRERPMILLGTIVVALAAGAGYGWMLRPPNFLAAAKRAGAENAASRWSDSNKQWLADELARIETEVTGNKKIKAYRDAIGQLLYARNVLDAPDRELGLWAVIKYHPGDEDETIDAAQELFDRYLADRDYDRAMALGQELINRDEHRQKMFGYLFQGIVLSLKKLPDASNACFVEMLEHAQQINPLPEEQRLWLARQFVESVRRNADLRGTQRDPELIRQFRERFLRTTPPPR